MKAKKNPYQSNKPMTREHEYCLNKVDEFRRVEWKLLNAITNIQISDGTLDSELVELCEYIRKLLPLGN